MHQLAVAATHCVHRDALPHHWRSARRPGQRTLLPRHRIRARCPEGSGSAELAGHVCYMRVSVLQAFPSSARFWRGKCATAATCACLVSAADLGQAEHCKRTQKVLGWCNCWHSRLYFPLVCTAFYVRRVQCCRHGLQSAAWPAAAAHRLAFSAPTAAISQPDAALALWICASTSTQCTRQQQSVDGRRQPRRRLGLHTAAISAAAASHRLACANDQWPWDQWVRAFSISLDLAAVISATAVLPSSSALAANPGQQGTYTWLAPFAHSRFFFHRQYRCRGMITTTTRTAITCTTFATSPPRTICTTQRSSDLLACSSVLPR